jgi:hypothetical protein
MSTPSARRWRWRSLWAAVVVAGVVLKALLSPFFIFNAAYDDGLMVEMARGFLDGHWSSSWSSTGIVTLAKPVGFPLFLAGAHALPWSPVMTVYLLALAGAVLTAWSWRRLSGSWAQATAVLTVLILDPIAFTATSQRVYRDSFIGAVTDLAIGLAFVIAAELGARRRVDGGEPADDTGPAHRHRRPSRLRRGVPFVLALCIGLLVGVVAVTKPTWQWLPIAISAPLAVPLLRRLRAARWRPVALARVGLACLLAAVGTWGVIESVIVMNQRTYGVALVEDFSAGGLSRTWKAWASVEAGTPEHGVQITRPMRLAVYRVSPTAAELASYLESPDDPWKSIDCTSSVHICDESGNWFEWDLQSAAASTGTVHSAVEFQQFFDRLADEIEHACTAGSLRCTSSPVLATGLPPLDRIPVGSLASETARGMEQMTVDRLPMGSTDLPRPTPAQYRLWSSVVPGMAPIGDVSADSTPSGVLLMLELLDGLARIVDLVLLAAITLGVVAWMLDRTVWRRRGRVPGDPVAGVASALFLVSWVVGMGLLAVFAAGRAWPDYVEPVYWTDFATPAQLCLVLGAFAAWPTLRGRLRRDSAVAVPGGTPGPA